MATCGFILWKLRTLEMGDLGRGVGGRRGILRGGVQDLQVLPKDFIDRFF